MERLSVIFKKSGYLSSVQAKGHVGIGFIFASLILLVYPGNYYDTRLWVFISIFVRMTTWPDIDLRLELKHRGFTHTVLGSLVFGFIATIFGMPHYTLEAFLGGFEGTLVHMLGDVFTI